METCAEEFTIGDLWGLSEEDNLGLFKVSACICDCVTTKVSPSAVDKMFAG